MLIWSPYVEFRCEVESSITMRNERVEDIGDEVDGRGLFGVIVGKRQAKFEDRVGVVALVNKEGGIPDEWVIDEWNNIHPEGTVRLISQRSILEGDSGTRDGTDRRRSRRRFTMGRLLRCMFQRSASCTSANTQKARCRPRERR